MAGIERQRHGRAGGVPAAGRLRRASSSSASSTPRTSASRSASRSSAAAPPASPRANRLLQLLADDPETDGAPRRGPGRGHREGQDLRRAQPVRRGHAARAAAGALPRPDARGLAQGGLRVRRGHKEAVYLTPTAKRALRIPTAAAVQEPRQRGHLGLGAGALPAAAGRGGRRVRPHRDGGDAAARRGRPRRRRALRRQGPRQGRRAAGQLRARHRHHRAGHRAGRGLLGPPDRRRDPRVRPRRGRASPRSGSSASRRSGRSPSRWTASSTRSARGR